MLFMLIAAQSVAVPTPAPPSSAAGIVPQTPDPQSSITIPKDTPVELMAPTVLLEPATTEDGH